MEIEKIYVSSSNIEAVGYDEATETLRVWFLNGSVYDYSGVNSLEFEGLRDAPSVGSYLHQNIKGQYPYVKVG
ncbi:MAG: KTSC domain-containing protein [Flavobacteriales bacterium]|nr:KTSC domain-containing protein [Flavobacteriales bacterium]